MLRSAALAWSLLGVVLAVWIATALLGEDGEPVPPRAGGGDLRVEVNRLEAEVERLRTARDPSLQGASDAVDPAAVDAAARAKREAERDAEREAEREARRLRSERSQGARELVRGWIDAVRSVRDKRDRERALAEIYAAFSSPDPVEQLAALRTARWLGSVEYDHDAFRAAILPYATSEDEDLRRAAREALGAVQPKPEDLAMWIEEAQSATRSNAEETAWFIVRTADGKLVGEAADAVLHLLQDGTKISRSMVIRGLQQAREFDPRLEARLIEIASGPDGKGSRETNWFYHFLADRFDTKSDAMVDMALDHIAAGREIDGAVRSMRKGLSEAQKARAARELVALAESAGTSHQRVAILGAFQYLRGHGDADRLQALADDPNADEASRRAAAQAAAAARRR